MMEIGECAIWYGKNNIKKFPIFIFRVIVKNSSPVVFKIPFLTPDRSQLDASNASTVVILNARVESAGVYKCTILDAEFHRHEDSKKVEVVGGLNI